MYSIKVVRTVAGAAAPRTPRAQRRTVLTPIVLVLVRLPQQRLQRFLHVLVQRVAVSTRIRVVIVVVVIVIVVSIVVVFECAVADGQQQAFFAAPEFR